MGEGYRGRGHGEANAPMFGSQGVDPQLSKARREVLGALVPRTGRLEREATESGLGRALARSEA